MEGKEKFHCSCTDEAMMTLAPSREKRVRAKVHGTLEPFLGD